MKAYWGSGDVAPFIIDVGPRWFRVISFTPWPLYPQVKSPCYPLDRKQDVPQNPSGHGGEEKIFSASAGVRTTDYPARSPVLCHLTIKHTNIYCKSYVYLKAYFILFVRYWHILLTGMTSDLQLNPSSETRYAFHLSAIGVTTCSYECICRFLCEDLL
jgi:hypothetical protein